MFAMPSMIHLARPAVTHYFHLKFVLWDFEKWGRMDERTDIQTPRNVK